MGGNEQCTTFVTTLFFEIDKRDLLLAVSMALSKHYGPWSAIRIINLTIYIERVSPIYPPTNETLGRSVGLVLRTVTSTQDCVWTYVWSTFNIASNVGTFICVNQGQNQRETTSNGNSFVL